LVPPLPFQRLQRAFQIAGGIVHVRLFYLDVVEPDWRIELDRADLGAFAHDLLVNLAVGRHIDHQVAKQLRLTGEAAAGLHALARLVALLHCIPFAGMFRAAHDAVLREFAEAELDLTAPTDPAAAANGVDVYPKLPRAAQERRAEQEAPAPARRREDDQCLPGRFRHGHLCFASDSGGGTAPSPYTPALARTCHVVGRRFAELPDPASAADVDAI